MEHGKLLILLVNHNNGMRGSDTVSIAILSDRNCAMEEGTEIAGMD